MNRHIVKISETIATIISEDKYFAVAESEIRNQREIIEKYILENPVFKTTLEPYGLKGDEPGIIKEMIEATRKAGVGPMASVAGAIGKYTLERMIRKGAEHAIIDNGGDIAMKINKPVIIGIFTGPSKVKNLGFRVLPNERVIGICTSSGTVGHSLSFGKADAAVVFGYDVILADAIATALCNSIQEENTKHIENSMKSMLIEGIEGMMVIIGETVGVCGNLPEIVKVSMGIEKISKG